MNKKSFLFAFVGLFFSVNGAFAEKVYKEIVIDGEKVNKWMELDSIEEYDQQERVMNTKIFLGEKIYETLYEYKGKTFFMVSKDSDGSVGSTTFIEKDTHDNVIHCKYESIDCSYENWTEYNSKNQPIHRMCKGDVFGPLEYWAVCDDNGNRISAKDDAGLQYSYKYAREKLIYEKTPNSVTYYDYDGNGREIYCKHAYSSLRHDENPYIWEETWKWYNDKNDVIQKKEKRWTIDRAGNVKGEVKEEKVFYTYDYEYYPNGKLKKKTTYSCRG
ncbi:hypothetical protein [uncultured Treponema sp.]|uniref:hypothetical protein n=1 Tax=uncultured Treponema sp. TaxID=162155 RepID=UPI0025D819BD|nr:hypothetical protein [uncultured Treponema sp.]